jgi:hypothetical protein
MPLKSVICVQNCSELSIVLKTHDHLICNHFSRKVKKSGSRKVIREIWFEKFGSRKVGDQKKRWFYTINPPFFRLEKSG